jgi:hypothetical protein
MWFRWCLNKQIKFKGDKISFSQRGAENQMCNGCYKRTDRDREVLYGADLAPSRTSFRLHSADSHLSWLPIFVTLIRCSRIRSSGGTKGRYYFFYTKGKVMHNITNGLPWESFPANGFKPVRPIRCQTRPVSMRCLKKIYLAVFEKRSFSFYGSRPQSDPFRKSHCLRRIFSLRQIPNRDRRDE